LVLSDVKSWDLNRFHPEPARSRLKSTFELTFSSTSIFSIVEDIFRLLSLIAQVFDKYLFSSLYRLYGTGLIIVTGAATALPSNLPNGFISVGY